MPIQEFNNVFVSIVDRIPGEAYDLPGTYTFLVIATISLLIHISVKNDFIRVKNEKLLENIQILQNSNKKLDERIHIIESDNHCMAGKIHSMSTGYETLQNVTKRLSERIHTAEIENQNLFKS